MRPISTIIALGLLSAATPAMARTTSQFRHFFPAWDGLLLNIIEENCTSERDAYHDSSNQDAGLPFLLANCVLDGMEEFRKTEMGITAVILGLLPTILQQVGPTVAEVSVLATRRPLLTLMLSIAMPAVSTGGPLTDPADALRRPVDIHIRAGVLAKARWPWLLISGAEYLIALAAVTNLFHLLYQLAFLSVSVSSIAVYTGGLSQAYSPFLWVILALPAHLLGIWGLKLRYRLSEQVPEKFSKRKSWWSQIIGSEFTPCADGEPLLLTQVKKGLLFVLVNFFTEMASVAMFVFGTVALSSQIFISLGDVVPLIARFMIGTLICRLILVFELYGLREVTSRSIQDGAVVVDGGYESVDGHERKSGPIERERAV